MNVTPSTATKVSNFNSAQVDYVKDKALLQGRDVYTLNKITGIYYSPVLLEASFLYSFISDTLISDGDTIEDSDGNQFTVYVYNGSTVAINEFIRIRVKDTTAYLLTYN